jgi:ATPase subunit of ABC transporter with duplicated ATPase domains
MTDGDIAPTGSTPRDSGGRVRVQPAASFESQHKGIVLQFAKRPHPPVGGFDYFAQDHTHGIPPGVPLWEWLYSLDEPATPADRASKEDIRNLLGRMLFSGDEALKNTDVLSGGETARLLFAKLMLLKQNVLIFDEPTNHLDLESISALRDAIRQFEGTVIFVTHDRDLVADAATRILAMSKHGIDDFQGSYEEFLRKTGDARLDR